MNSFFFYFSISDIDKALYFLEILHKNFAEIFGSKYEGFHYKNNDDLLKTKRHDCKEIWWVHAKSEFSPYSALKFWNDSFSISMEMWYLFQKDAKIWNWWDILLEKAKIFSEKILEELPILAMNFGEWDEPFENGVKNFFHPQITEWIIFWYVRENEKLRYIQGKSM